MQKSTHIPTLAKLQRTKEQLYLTVHKQEQVVKLQLACLPGETIAMALYSVLPDKLNGKISHKIINGIRNGMNKGLMKMVKKDNNALTQTGDDLKKKEKSFFPAVFRAYKLFKKYKVV